MNQQTNAPDIVSGVSALSSAAWAYAGLAASFELGIVAELGSPATASELGERLDLDPDLVADLLGVLVALGAIERRGAVFAATPAFEPFRSGSLAKVMTAGVRSDHLQTAAAFRDARDGVLAPGWEHFDPDVLVAQGETAGLFRLAAEVVLPSLDGLGERLASPGARFLDVGAGIGVLSSELCLVYPELTAECLEPNPIALEIGRERCVAAGLAGRIEFVPVGVEELVARDRYDLALIPQPFLSAPAFRDGLELVSEALRPGGWLVVLALDLPGAEPLVAASRRLRARLWGGGAVDSSNLIAQLADAGLDDAHAHPPVGAYRMYAARAPQVAAAAEARAEAPTAAASG